MEYTVEARKPTTGWLFIRHVPTLDAAVEMRDTILRAARAGKNSFERARIVIELDSQEV